MSDFSFPLLPKPKPLAQGPEHAAQLAATNPLLARATVTDRTASSGGEAAQAAPAAAASTAAPQAGADMGGAMSQPVTLSRHGRFTAPRKKVVPFEKGYSQMDWVRLTQSGADLAGLGPGGRPRRGITMEEVAQHCTREDCWTVLRGKVYNMTPYLQYHPGGVPLLLKIAGKDGTALFNKYHAWVNYEFLLGKCLVGLLAPPSTAGAAGTAGERAAAAPGAAAPAAAMPPPPPRALPAGEQRAGAGQVAGAGTGSSNSSSTTSLGQQQEQQQERQQGPDSFGARGKEEEERDGSVESSAAR